MYEAHTTVIGTVITHPMRRDLSNGEQMLTFRMASNSRRFDATSGEWTDNGTLYLTISCWRRLVSGVDRSLHRGDPVIAYGQLRSHEYRGKDGTERRDLEMRAVAVGPDLARCHANVIRRSEGLRSLPHAVVRNISEPRDAVPAKADDAATGYAMAEPVAVACTTVADPLPARSPDVVSSTTGAEQVDA
ncbi:single-stranded DNA-binding protein [Nocardia alba]|uniref:Single-strand DNA-binding protein n=1 Tax=Nocardia alba TaxID=225051 RepID=A0A4R1FN95_9NOCA|nr:single-stranded DNA-binding protein [Nocardia alba]TCJ93748.1 single-strand DNA-binding protein [Nocardia alba]